MKKYLVSIISFMLALCCTLGSAAEGKIVETDASYTPTSLIMGDVNHDNSVNAKDVLLLRKFVAKMDVMPNFERADVNGDTKLNAKDVLILRKHNAHIKVDFAAPFAAEYFDATASLEDMGIPYQVYWNDVSDENVVARDPKDMAAFDGKIFFTGGNYNINLGPVNIEYVTRNGKKTLRTSDLTTEAVERLYIYDDTLYCLAADPQRWLMGEFYIYNAKQKKWNTKQKLPNNIHLYDLLKHDGKYFLSGSSVSYDNPAGLEQSIGNVYRVDEPDLSTAASSSFYDVPFYDKNGTLIVYDRLTGVPRVHELIEFGGELYAFLYDYYDDFYAEHFKEYVSPVGIYKYDEKDECFKWCDGKNIMYAYTYSSGIVKDHESIMRDFAWGDEYIFINGGIITTKDLGKFDVVKVPGYEDYNTYDVIFVGDKMYYLLNKKGKDDHYDNVVVETGDIKNWRPIFHFDTLGYVRSFEYTDGFFAFGIGTYRADAMTPGGHECGRIYRFKYYN